MFFLWKKTCFCKWYPLSCPCF